MSDFGSFREQGSYLEDEVATYFKRQSFEVELRKKMKDRSDVFHEIDVIAKKSESFGQLIIAIECKNVSSKIDIQVVRDFHDKLTSLNITKGIIVSTGGFTEDAKAHSKALFIDLWDERLLNRLLQEVSIPDKDVIRNGLPVHPRMGEYILPESIINNKLFDVYTLISYKPFYFAEYHCFSQHWVEGNSVLIESRGELIIDAMNGMFVSYQHTTGNHSPDILKNDTYTDCLKISPQTINTIQLSKIAIQENIEEVAPIIDISQARELAKTGLLKALTYEHHYDVKRATKDSTYYVSKVKTLHPRLKEIKVENVRLAKIPDLFVNLRYKDKSYHRVFQAATIKITKDDTISCPLSHIISDNTAVAICENCGQIICNKHKQICSICGRLLCEKCTTKCKNCKESMCYHHLQECPICDNEICNRCIDICQNCEEEVCNKDTKKCSVCGKTLCANCIVGSGLILKKYYCKEHAPLK